MEKIKRTPRERDQAIKAFIKRWSGSHKEDEDARSFLIELMQDVLGEQMVTQRINFEKKVRISGHVKRIDAYLPETRTLIEMKSSHVDMNHMNRDDYKTAIEQAKKYYDALPYDERGRFIITSNFKEIWIYDLNDTTLTPDKIQLENLEKDAGMLQILVNPEYTTPEAERRKHQKELSVKAGELVGTLYNLFLKQYGSKPDEQELKELNMLIVRLVFCLYAEDAELFEPDQFHDFLLEYKPQNLHLGLEQLFQVLDTPVIDRKTAYMTPSMAAFPYVNGGLFKEKIHIPVFTPEITANIIHYMSEELNWSGISPTIFGALFESTLNPETRATGGMHYTSEENIHKVIDPLFLDDLKVELEKIKSIKTSDIRKQRLQEFQQKLGTMRFLDPACGSGNFLTESYLSLRRLENEALELLVNVRGGVQIGLEMQSIHVHIDQFYGIEINDFAVSVATTALYIAEAQMFRNTQKIVMGEMKFFPLRSYHNIHEGNALTIDWNTVFPKREIAAKDNKAYIMGNPPFLGASKMSSLQKQQAVAIYGKGKRVNSIDYVGAWFHKAAAFMRFTDIKTAFVATNSITQGEQVYPLWNKLINEYKIHIDFAYRTFKWDSEAKDKAAVHCVIIGFSFKENKSEKLLFTGDAVPLKVSKISPYLIEAPDILIESRSKPLCRVPKMTKGNQPTDNRNFILTPEEKDQLLSMTPQLAPYIRRYIGAEDFINDNTTRYCLWLKDASPEIYRHNPIVMKRLKAIKEFRLKSPAAPTRKFAEKPYQFFSSPQTEGQYLCVPRNSSMNRQYIPIDFMDGDTIASDAVSIIMNASIYQLGILSSSVHMAWVRAIAGRLKSDYRYSGQSVYNPFPWPDPTSKQREKIESTAQAILDARASSQNTTFAGLYNELSMPIELRKAHQANDKAVMEAYGFSPKMSESEIVEALFKLYEKLVQKEEEKK